ncbi:MAG: hypothetical protein IPQ02_08990 [Saprospiraceae bacterium]|uniref:Uncharacterized protein n=1 Tax=Candidatus Defluviibacterium haderslevense TaxID=2981993 RepID=A0A9D7XHP0_9BACT|nr:hypothetical protein [Candidatus Defluviibacterium haderslevense]MBL0236728.1 hypothetical protein [Candidatus Defluviibacterium haderslevense]
MKFNILCILIVFVLFKNNAQTFTPFEFENYTPLWTRISTTSKLPLNIQGNEMKKDLGMHPW